MRMFFMPGGDVPGRWGKREVWVPLVLFLALRVGLSFWAVVVLTLVPADLSPDPHVRPYLGSEPARGGLAGCLLEPWQRFDTTHYVHLAREWYRLDEDMYSIRLPLYPLLIRWLGRLLDGRDRYLLGALLISNTAAAGYFIAFAALARDAVGPRGAGYAQLYATVYPWAFFLLAGYAESISLLLVALGFLGIRRERWWMAGVCATLAALTRVQGAVLALPLLYEMLRQPRFRSWPLCLNLAWALMPGLAVGGFMFWRAQAGFEPMPVVWAARFHDIATWPGESLLYAVRVLISGGGHFNDYLELGAALLFLVLMMLAWRKLSPTYVLYMIAAWWLSLSRMRFPHPLAGMGRYMLALFPAFFFLGQAGARSPWLNRLILYLSVLLALFLSGQYVLWGWVG
jgi:hypothetical protein